MNIKKYLELSNQKLSDLENKYNFLPNESDIEQIHLSADKACLRETARIARLHSLQKSSEAAQKKLAQKRKAAIQNLFVRPNS